MNAPEFQIPYRPDADGKATVAVHELRRLVENSRRLDYLLTHCSYLEDGRSHEHYWSRDDEARMDGDERLSLADYLDLRIAGKPIPIAAPKDEAGENIPDGDDYEERKLREAEPMHYAGLLYPHQEPV